MALSGSRGPQYWGEFPDQPEVLPVCDHLVLPSAQFLASAQQPDHPSYQVINLNPGPRRLKETLTSKVGHFVEPHLVNGVLPAGTYKTTFDRIHTRVV